MTTNTNAKVPVRAVTAGSKHHFFGFHDLSPWDASGRFMLAMETDFIDRPPMPKDTARVCVIDTRTNALRVVGETTAWNFHQGSRAQWMPNESHTIIFNSREQEKFVSVVLNIETGAKRTLPYPIYAVSPDGSYAFGLNFSRLQTYGGYGYRGGDTTVVEESAPKNDGIFRIDLHTGDVKLIVPTHDVVCLNDVLHENENHMLTHIAFNPSGTRVCFIDKYRLSDGGFIQRLITMDPDGTALYALPGHVSHFCWRNHEEILAYGKLSPGIMALRKKGVLQNPLLKPLLNLARKMRGELKQRIAGQSYFLLKDKTQNAARIAVGVMTEDGHPMFSPDGRFVATDTYPTDRHLRTLILYRWESGTRFDLGNFHSLPDPRYAKDGNWDVSEMRADLHPRWNKEGTAMCFDSVHEGMRQMYIADVSGIVNI